MPAERRAPPALTRDEAERFLIREARLIDDRRLDEWLALFTSDALYWLPAGDGDPALEPSIIYDDRARLEERVFRLNETRAYAQEPPSRTQHTITNVEIDGEPSDDGVRVRCHLTLFEVRTGDASQAGLGTPQILAGRCEYILRRTATWQIARKTVWLLTRDLPLSNLSFIV
jgi:3-phenylpropionate/cinnamic acid dioxygenase small subunit